MQDALEEWSSRLEPVELPAFTHSVRELERLAADDNVAMPRLTAVIERDPGLTLRLLRRMNALRHRHLRTDVTTVHHALMMMGLTALRKLPEAMPTVEALPDKAMRVRIRRLYASAFHAASQARDWAQFHRELEPGESYVAALFHRLGDMVLALEASDRLHAIEQLKHGDEMEAEEAEFVTLGFGLDQLGTQLAGRWGLPAIVAESLQPENAGRLKVLGIMLAARLAQAAESDWYTPAVTTTLEQVSEFLPRAFGSTAARVHATAVDVARESGFYGIRPAAAWLLLPSRPEAAPGLESRPASDEGEFCLCPQGPVFDAVLARLGSDRGDVGLPGVLELALKGLHEGLGLNRVAFALLTPEKTQLKARAVLGAETDARFNRFSVDVDADNLFGKLLSKPQAVWFDNNNRATFEPLLPAGFLQHVKVGGFFLMSLFVKGHPVGVFYADRHTDACRLDARAYHRFKQLCLHTGKAMARLSGG